MSNALGGHERKSIKNVGVQVTAHHIAGHCFKDFRLCKIIPCGHANNDVTLADDAAHFALLVNYYKATDVVRLEQIDCMHERVMFIYGEYLAKIPGNVPDRTCIQHPVLLGDKCRYFYHYTAFTCIGSK